MAVKGAVLGDILGAQFEFDRPKKLDWKNVPLAEGDAIGFTDDTVMTLAIKKALKTEADLVETMVEVGREYPFAGCGGFGNVDADGLLKKYLTPELWEILNM